MSFEYQEKKPGDLLQSKDWNALIQEIKRLDTAKVNRQDQDSLTRQLTINGALTINGNVKIGTPTPSIKLEVVGDLTVTGAISGTISAKSITSDMLDIDRIPNLSASKITNGTFPDDISVAKQLSFGSSIRQMINLYGTEYGIGIQSSTQYFRTDGNFAWHKGGGHDTRALNAGKNNNNVDGIVQMVILENGNVGIGTKGPTKKLEVAGDLKVTESISGKIDATSITSGLLDANRIPNLSADKITAGTFPDDISVANRLSFGSKDRQMINLYGNSYGIGIQAYTQYFRTDGNFAWYKGGIHSDSERDAGKDGTVQMVIADGNVGIGTSQPTKGKVEIQGSVSYFTQTISSYSSLSNNGVSSTTTIPPQVSKFSPSLWADNEIGATRFNAFSDLRIKEIQGHSDSQADLQTLLQIKVTDYYYKDTISNGDTLNKKVIGQQVATVYPQAVSTHTDTVPDIFQFALIAENWVTLVNHNLNVGERIKIQWEETTEVFMLR